MNIKVNIEAIATSLGLLVWTYMTLENLADENYICVFFFVLFRV